MINGIIGKKLGMTQVFDETGRLVPVTVIEAGPCVVTQIKTLETDGYEAVQVAFGEVKESRVNKPMKGHFGKAANAARELHARASKAARDGEDAQDAGEQTDASKDATNQPKVRPASFFYGKYVREVPVDGLEGIELGQEVRADIFGRGDIVKVTGISKGKGFAGAVKRWHFHGADMTHGSMIHRKPQSGGATDAARTFKGVKRPGHMGNRTVTQRGLTVYRVDPERNVILVKGAVPGATGAVVTITRQAFGG
ncbi:MAG: 50S ribosomal protein L3 [Armatimonadota bacterium]